MEIFLCHPYVSQNPISNGSDATSIQLKAILWKGYIFLFFFSVNFELSCFLHLPLNVPRSIETTITWTSFDISKNQGKKTTHTFFLRTAQKTTTTTPPATKITLHYTSLSRESTNYNYILFPQYGCYFCCCCYCWRCNIFRSVKMILWKSPVSNSIKS